MKSIPAELKPVVLGAACGYSTGALAPFAESALHALPGARVILFVDPSSPPSIPGVELQAVNDAQLRRLIRALPRCRTFVSNLSLRLGKGVTQLTGQDTILTRAAFGVAVARYFWYLTWLKRYPGDENQPILLSDTRDVVLQGDPFQGLPSEKLFCGEEPVLLANCSGNALWYRCAYGSDALLRAGSNNVLCSGVIGGSRSRIMEYLECMCEEILRVGRRIVWAAGYDQALHNHLIRQGGIGHLFTVEPWNSNRLATLHYATDTAFTLREDGVLLGPSGNAVSIVHQYDRHEKLQSWVNQRWGLNRSFVKQAN